MITGSIAIAILAAVESIILSRVLGPDEVGQYQLAVTICITLVTLFSLGIGQANIYLLNSKKSSIHHIIINSIYFATALGLSASLVLISIFYFFNTYTGQFSPLVVIAMSINLIFILLHVFLGQILISQMRVFQFNAISFSNKLLSIILLIALTIYGILDSGNAIIVYILCNLYSAIFSCFVMRKYLHDTHTFDAAASKITISYGIKYYFVNLLLAFDNNLSILFISILLPGEFEAIGYYTRAVAICMVIRLIPISLTNLLFAHWARYDMRTRTQQLERTVRYYSLLGMIFILFIVVFGRELILLMYGAPFLPALPILQVLSFQQVMWILSNAFQSFFFAAGRPAFITWNLLITNIVNITGMVTIGYYYGVIGVACAITIGQVISVIICIKMAELKYGLNIPSCFKIAKSDFIELARIVRLIPKIT